MSTATATQSATNEAIALLKQQEADEKAAERAEAAAAERRVAEAKETYASVLTRGDRPKPGDAEQLVDAMELLAAEQYPSIWESVYRATDMIQGKKHG